MATRLAQNSSSIIEALAHPQNEADISYDAPYSIKKQQIALAVTISNSLDEIREFQQEQYIKQQQLKEQERSVAELIHTEKEDKHAHQHPDFIIDAEYLALLEKREMLIEQFGATQAQVNKIFDSTFSRLNRMEMDLKFMKLEVHEINKPHIELQKQNTQAIKQDMEQGLSKLMPQLKPARKKAILEKLVDFRQQQATMVEVEARYLDSMQQHTKGSDKFNDEREKFSISSRDGAKEELQQLFKLMKVFRKELGLGYTPISIAPIHKMLSSTYYQRDNILQRAQKSAKAYKSEDVEKNNFSAGNPKMHRAIIRGSRSGCGTQTADGPVPA